VTDKYSPGSTRCTWHTWISHESGSAARCRNFSAVIPLNGIVAVIVSRECKKS